MRVLAVAGASGGHIFPAISFLEAVRDRQKDIRTLLVLPKRSPDIRNLNYRGCVKYISISRLRFRPDLCGILSLFNFVKGSFESLFLILEFRPDVVAGFGTLDSVPLVMLAWFFRIKTIIHEQNVLPGRANRLLAKFSDKVAVSFAETKKYLNISADKLILTGNPLRRGLKMIDKEAALGFFGFASGKFTLLVMGGSQGSKAINRAFLKAVLDFKDKDSWQVIHISGQADADLLTRGYQEGKVTAKVFPFLSSMEYAYSVADLVLSRSGATTIAELMRFNLPAVLIPYPFAKRHQSENARVLSAAGCAVVIEEQELSRDHLGVILAELIRGPEKIRSMRLRYAGFSAPDASIGLADAALALI